MAKSDPLFLLIKGLDRAEKRYFKLHATRYSTKYSKDYLRLFNAIDAQKVYDEAALIKKFKDEPYLRHLRSVKSYLHHQIMKGLRSFYDHSSITIKLNNYLTDIEILFKKELYKNCGTVIKKAKAFAREHERFPHLLKIIEWEMRHADYTANFEESGLLVQSTRPLKAAIADYNEIIDLQQIYLELRAAAQINGRYRSVEERAALDKISQNPLLLRKIKSFKGEEYRLITRLNYALLSTDYERMNEAAEELMKLYQSQNGDLDVSFNSYIKLLLTMAENCRLEKKYLAAESLMQKIAGLCSKNHKLLSLASKLRLMQAETELMLCKGEFGQARKHLQSMHDVIETEPKEVSHEEMVFFYCLAFSANFSYKDFEGAQHYINKLINYENAIPANIQSSARISNLILQYEQNELEHLSYVIQSTYRYLAKKQKLLEAEAIVLNFLRKSVKLTSAAEILNALKLLKNKISPHINESFLIGIPLIEWIDSKLQKRELADIIKENYMAALATEKSL